MGSFSNRLTVRKFILPVFALAVLSGCSDAEGDKPAGGHADHDRANSLHGKLTSAHYFLSAGDIEKFRPGRSKKDVLKDVQWRGDLYMASMYKGRSVCAIAYNLFSEGPNSGVGEVAYAIFVADKFVKFVLPVGLLPSEEEEYDYEGTKMSRPKPIKVGDASWLIRQVESQPLSIPDLKERVKASAPTPSQTDVGLTIAWLLMRRTVGNAPALRVATEDEYKRNAELRDQYNASRLEIGMTESEVEAVFRAKPVYSGKAEAGSCKIYGSNETFNIEQELRFSNVLVVFTNEKVSIIRTVSASDHWLREFRGYLSDLSVLPERVGERGKERATPK